MYLTLYCKLVEVLITIYNAILFFFLELNEKSFAKKTTSNFSSDTLKIHFRKFTAASAFTVSKVLKKVLATMLFEALCFAFIEKYP